MGRRDRSVRRSGTDAPSRRPVVALITVVLATVGLVVSLVVSAPALRVRTGPEPASRVTDRGALVTESSSAGTPAARPQARREAGPQAGQQARQQAEPQASPQAGPQAGRVGRPARVTVPAVGLDLPVVPVGVREDGQMQLPEDLGVLGWYRFGPAPGEPGSAVVAGHVDSSEYGVGPLVRLRDVEPGDAVVVRTARGRVVLTVTDVRRYAKSALPADVFARTGKPLLRIITCGGDFDEAAGSYEENLVVTAGPRV